MNQVNNAWIVREPSQAQEVWARARLVFADTGIELKRQPSTRGIGFPEWTSIIFSAQHDSWERLVADVSRRIENSQLVDYLEPA